MQDVNEYQKALALPVERMGEVDYMRDSKNRLTPVDQIPERDLLEDQLVRGVFASFMGVRELMRAAKARAMDDVQAFRAAMAERHNVTMGGEKGNLQFLTFDGRYRLQVSVQNVLQVNSDVEVAEQLINQCLDKWTKGSPMPLRAIVDRAFKRNADGVLSTAALVELRGLKIDDEDWNRAMGILADAMRVVATREYIRVHERKESGWELVPLDLAKV